MAVGWDTRDSRSCARPLSYIRRRWAGTVATWMASGGQDRRGKDRRASLGQRLDAVLRRGVAVGGVDTAVAANGRPRPRRIEGQRVTMVVGGGCGRLQTSTRVHSYEIQVCCPIVVAGARDGGARGGWWWKRSGPIARFERYGAASPGCEGLPVKVFRSRSPDWGHAAPARTDSNTVQCDGGRRVRLCAARSLKSCIAGSEVMSAAHFGFPITLCEECIAAGATRPRIYQATSGRRHAHLSDRASSPRPNPTLSVTPIASTHLATPTTIAR